GGTGGAGGPVGCVDFTRDLAPIVAERCGFAGCHGGGQPAAGLNLAGPAALDALQARVIPGEPEASRLIQVLDPTVDAGVQMPPGTPLGAGELALFAAWVAQGAAAEAPVDCEAPPPAPAAVEVQVEAPAQLAVGALGQGRAVALDESGAEIEEAVRWTSADPARLWVDDEGGLLGLAPGAVTLTAASGAARASVAVQVVPADPTPARFQGEVVPVLRARCATAGCHVDGVEPGDLRFDRDGDRLWRELVEDGAEQVDGPRVVPGEPGAGWLMRKLLEPDPGVGGQMPLGAGRLPAEAMQPLVTWILGGALP
ncbi:MAG: hypothetical protein KC613_23510, partial [Myxococcales bacterium]|nr:hypothetical protein [Myxococcales bacterium]